MAALARVRRDPKYRQAALVVAIVGFVLGLFLSLRAQPDLLADLAWTPVLVAAGLVMPGAILLNAADFRISAAFVENRIDFRSAVEVTLVGSAANLLPLPGAFMARIGALRLSGTNFRQGTYVTLLSGALWLAMAMVYGAGWLMLEGRSTVAWGLIVSGIPLGAGAAAALLRLVRRWRLLVVFVAAKLILVIADALILWLCLQALGVAAGFAVASVMTVSGPAGSLALVLPGGLGLREATAAFLGTLLGTSAASGFVAASLARILVLVVIVPVAAYLALTAAGRARFSGGGRDGSAGPPATGESSR